MYINLGHKFKYPSRVIHHTPIESKSNSCRSVTSSFNMFGKFIHLSVVDVDS